MNPEMPGEIVPLEPLEPQGDPDRVSIVTVNWNARETIIPCIESVERARETLATRGLEVELFVVDNASTDGSVEALRERFPDLDLQANRRNAGFAAANNQAFSRCRGRWILLLNPDTELDPGALEGMVDYLKKSDDVGAVGVSLVDQEGRRQNAHDNFPWALTELFNKHLLRMLFPRRFPSKRTQGQEPFEVQVIIGACLMLRAEVLWRLDGFDEDYFLFVEEADLCRRIWNGGYRVVQLPALEIVHGLHPSKSKAPTWASLEAYRSTAHFLAKHGSRALARAFQVIRGAKLVGLNVLLSFLGTVFTLGRVPGHIRRLRIRARLAWWYLHGCPDSWGMRVVSPLIGFIRERRGTSEWILPEGADGELIDLLRDPWKALEERPGRLVKILETSSGVEARILEHDELPPPWSGELPGEAACRLGWLAYPDTHVRGGSELAPGIREFELALQLHDRGDGRFLPVAAGVDRDARSHARSHVIFLAPPGTPDGEFEEILLADRERIRLERAGARRRDDLPPGAARYAQPARIPLETRETPA